MLDSDFCTRIMLLTQDIVIRTMISMGYKSGPIPKREKALFPIPGHRHRILGTNIALKILYFLSASDPYFKLRYTTNKKDNKNNNLILHPILFKMNLLNRV